MAGPTPPDGFAPHFRQSEFTDPWEPLFSRVLEDRVQIGLELASAHCNSRGLVHGGLIASLADNAMGLSCGQILRQADRSIAGLVTVSLTVDYLGSAKLGSWLMVDTDHIKVGGTLGFARCLVTSDGSPVAQSSATFKIT